jgi:hypothetical protein
MCSNPSKPSACAEANHTSERERESIFFYRFTPTLSGKSVCGKVLIRSILVLLFSSEVPLKNMKKDTKKEKIEKEEKQETT